LFRGGKEGEIRKKMIESDKLEYVITLVSGVFYSTGVSACILVLNNNKPADHIGKGCLVDASQIYSAQRAQNIMTENNVNDVFKLCSEYSDVIERAKVVTLNDLREKDYTLSVSVYIEKAAKETVAPAEVRRSFADALVTAKAAEKRLTELLAKGGYANV
jgi:type I restriction enzyme M protein